MRNLARVGLVLGFLVSCVAIGLESQESAFCVDSSSGLSMVSACKLSGWLTLVIILPTESLTVAHLIDTS